MEKQRDQLKQNMECLDNMSYFLGQMEMQVQRESEHQQECKKIQDRRPLGLRIKCALKDLSEDHGKLHRKQQAWQDGKREHDHAKKQMQECAREVENLKQAHDQRLQKHAEFEDKIKNLEQEKATEEGWTKTR